ncbi:MAG TPA: NUDIX domain-containing protein [Flavilitoribacter sp.]|nr:NUDIX domain-containing protein [Flavilitoribacter sp.]
MDKTIAFPHGLKRSGVMVVLQSGNRYLLLKRNKPPYVGIYTPIGGKLEPYEDPYSAAVRETWEETGIRPAGFRYAGVVVETSPGSYNWQCNIYHAEIPYQEAPPCDEGELALIRDDRLSEAPIPEIDHYMFAYLSAGRRFAFNAIFDENLNLLELTEEQEGKRLK